MSAARLSRPALQPLEDRTVPTAGTMDTSFGGGDGIAKFGVPGFASAIARGVAVQPDGKTVLAGTGDPLDHGQAMLYRLTVDGSLDPTFGGGDGVVALAIPGQDAVFYDVEVQPDGKIVAAGSTGAGVNFMVLVARFNPDGTPDPTFDGDGFVTTDLTSRDENGFSLALQADGKIVVCGNILSDSDDGFLFLRYTPEGALDPTFSLDGVQKYNGPGGALGRAVAIQPDGKIVGAGYGSPGGPLGRGLTLIRLNEDGTFDDTFDGDGIVVTFFPGAGSAEAHDVAVLPDGRLAAVGFAAVNSAGQPVAARYLADGSLDNTFDGDGRFLLQVPPDAAGGHLTSVAADPGGRIVAAGYTEFPHDALLIRFKEDGTPDADFGVGNFRLRPGVVSTNAGGGEEIYDLTILPNSRIVTAGRSDGNVLAIRYNGDNSVAVADAYSTPEDTALSVAAPGVMANDQVQAGATPQASLVQGPAHAAAFTLNADGSFTYAPSDNYHGPDSFRYTLAEDAFTSNVVTVSLTVQPVNDVPVAADDAYGFRFHSPLNVSAANGLLHNDKDDDGDTLHAVLLTQPAQGSVALNDDGSFAFTYPDGLTGSFSFTYRVTDGTADSAPATVTLTRAPNALPASGNDGYRLPFASPFSVSAADGVLRNDADADRDPLTVTVVAPPPVGTLTLRPDGSFDYAFPPTLVGSVTFTYRASDGVEEGNVATVTLTRERLVAVSGRQLIVIGTGGPDTVRISPAGGRTLLVTIQTPDQLTWQVMNPGPLPFTGITVRLGAGNDRLDVVAGSIPVTAVGGAGDDVIHTGLGNDDITGDDTFGGPAGDDVIDAGGGRNTVAAGDGDNVVRTGAGPDTITAGDGRQEIHAGGGNDSITVGTGGSFIDAGAGNDRVTAAGGQNWVQGGSGNDILIGGADGDALFGEGGNDLLVGGTGADFLDGGLGNDLLFDGRVAVNDPARDSLARVLASYAPSRHASLVNITNRLTVTPDPAATDNLTGGLGVDWFWSNDSLEALDRVASEPLNAVH